MPALTTSALGAFVKTTWPVLVVAFGGAIAWGSLQSDVKHIKAQQDTQVSDHDRIVRMETKQDQMSDDVKEMKQDIKEIAKAVK